MKPPTFHDRDWLPDQLKGWAVFWMILVHSVELFLKQSSWHSPTAQTAFFMGAVPAAPVFMFLMGYFVGRLGQSPKLLALRGLKVLGWGLLLNIGLNLNLLLHWVTGKLDVNPLEYIFGVDILILAGLALIISALLQQLKTPWYLWLLLALFLTLPKLPHPPHLLHPPHPLDYILALIGGDYRWSYFPLIPWLAYVFSGIGFRKLLLLKPSLLDSARIRFYATIPAVLIFLAGIIPGWKITQNLPAYYHHSLWFFIWAIAFIYILALVLLASKTKQQSAPGLWIRFLGVRVTNAYIIQWLILGNLATWLYQSLNLLQTLLLFILTLIVTTFITWFYHTKLKIHKR